MLERGFTYQVQHAPFYTKKLTVGGFQHKDQAAVARVLSRMPIGTAQPLVLDNAFATAHNNIS